MVSFEMMNVRPPALFLFRIVLTTWGPLRFHKDFWVGFSIYAKKNYWELDKDYMKSIDQFGYY